MRRYGRFVDARWIHQRMDAKDARVARETAARTRRLRAESLLARLAQVYTVESDQAALIALVAEARSFVQEGGVS